MIMKKLMLIKDQGSFQEVYNILGKVIDEIKSDFYLCLRRKDKHTYFNFAFYKTDKTNVIYEQLKENNKNILVEVECVEKYRG